MIRRLEVAAALLMLATMMVGSPADAQEAGEPTVDFVVTPSRLEVRIAPGDAIEFPIQVYNRSTAELKLTTYIQDIEIPDNDLVTSDELAFTASRWTSFSVEQILVPGGGSRSVNVRIAIPPATPSGGYHAFAFFQTEAGTSPIGVLPAGRIGVTLLVDVAEDGETIVREARVSDTRIDVTWDGIFSPRISSQTDVENIGDAHVAVGGLHTYRTWPSGSTSEAEVGPMTVLRGTQTSLRSEFTDVPWFGKVDLTSEIVYQVGPDDLPVIVTQVSVWIIPWRLIAPALVLVAAAIAAFLLVKAKKREDHFKNLEKEEWEHEPEYS